MNMNSRKITIKSRIPGRLRLKVPAIRFSNASAKALEGRLLSDALLKSAEARFKSGSVILLFDPDKVETDTVLDLVRSALSGPLALSLPDATSGHAVCGMECGSCRPVAGPAKRRKSLLGRVVEVVLITLFVGFILVRKLVFKVPLAQGVFSVVAGVALVGAIPLFRHAVNDLRQGKSMSLFPFLAATCVLAIFVGEAMTALEVIWILRVGMLLEDYVAEQSRRAISEILQVATKDTYILIDGVEVQTPVDQLREGRYAGSSHRGENPRGRRCVGGRSPGGRGSYHR